jgi:hypothetical protein
MKNRRTEILILLIVCIVFGILSVYVMSVQASPSDPLAWGSHFVPTKTDTIPVKVVVPPQPVIQDVKSKKVLFIGDSHTAADYGWQHQLCKKTKMTYLNTAVGGKQTAWMLQEARLKVNEYFDYCFIYGGANDMAGNRPPIKSVKNIQAIVDICHKFTVTPIVITGFDPVTCIDIKGRDVYKGYPQRYAKFQQMLVDSIHGATVVQTHCISRTDCGDFLCHMTSSGHKKMALCIIDKLNLKTYENLSSTKKH